MYVLFILGYVSFCAAQCVPEELTVRTATGESLPLGAYSSHDEFLTSLQRNINQKVQAAAQSLIRHTKIDSDQLLSNIDSNQYLFLHLIYALASKDVLFTNQLLERLQEIDINRNPISSEWIRSKVNIPNDIMYKAIETIVHANKMGVLVIPKEITNEILVMANVTELFQQSSEKGDEKVLQWLLDTGTKFDLTHALETPLKIGKWVVVKTLLHNGALSTVKDAEKIKSIANETLLHLAVSSNAPDAVSALLAVGTPINAVDEAGRSPLLIAVENNDTVSAKILLSKGADASKISNSGNTALHVAASNGNAEAVKLILRHSAPIQENNNVGLTPLNIADQSSIFHTINYLLHQNIKLPNIISTDTSILPYIYLFSEYKTLINESDPMKIENYCEETRLMNIRSRHVPFERDIKTKLLELVIKNGIPFLAECLINLGAELSFKNRNNETLLFSAVRAANSEIVRLLINEGIDVEAKDVNSTTALHVAAGNGYLDIVSLLLKRGADINAVTNEGFTSLHKAAKYGHIEVVEFLLDNKINVSSTVEKVQETPLQLAASNGHFIVVKTLLDRGVFNDYKTNETWNTLHAAAKAGHNDIVNFLLDSGFNVNVADEKGRTPLYWAAYGGRVITVLTLLERGADINTKSNHEVVGHKFAIILKSMETPLHVAALNGHLEVCKILIGKGLDKDAKDAVHETPLYNAALGGHYDVTKYLIERKAFKNSKNLGGSTALHAAAENGHNEVIDLLYDKGMDIDIETNHGRTPLHFASEKGHLSTVINLIDKLANVNAESVYGTPLSVAVKSGHTDIVFRLLESGGNIEVTDKDGNTLVMEAITSGHKDVLILLMKRGAWLNGESKRSDGKTALHLAMGSSDPSIAELLVESRASVYEEAKDGTTALFEAVTYKNERAIKAILEWAGVVINNTRKTDNVSCLHMAVRVGSLRITETLLDKGAYINAVDNKKDTPLHFAVYNEDYEIAKLLLKRGADVNIKNVEGKTPFLEAKERTSAEFQKTLRLCDCE